MAGAAVFALIGLRAVQTDNQRAAELAAQAAPVERAGPAGHRHGLTRSRPTPPTGPATGPTDSRPGPEPPPVLGGFAMPGDRPEPLPGRRAPGAAVRVGLGSDLGSGGRFLSLASNRIRADARNCQAPGWRNIRMSLLATDSVETARFRAYGPRQLDEIADRHGLPADIRETVRLVSMVLPFRVNEYVLSQLIDWDRIPDDPMFQLVFPQKGMLTEQNERDLATLSADPASKIALRTLVQQIRGQAQPAPVRPEGAQRPHPGGRRDRRAPAQVPRDGPVLPEPGPDLPLVLHLLLPLGPVRRGRGPALRGARPERPHLLPRLPPRRHRRAGDRWRPDGDVY